jgi:hypothetical protein
MKLPVCGMACCYCYALLLLWLLCCDGTIGFQQPTVNGRFPAAASPSPLLSQVSRHGRQVSKREIRFCTDNRDCNTKSILYMSSPSSSITSAVLEKLPSEAVINAVDDNGGRDGKVVASDIAAKAGVSLNRAAQDLVTLAALTRADVSVTRDGQVLYTFPTNVRAALAQRSAKYQALQTWEQKIWPIAFWVIRISFGVALLASLVAIFSSILFLQTSSNSSDDDRRRDRGFGGSMFGGYWGPSPFDVFYYRPYGTYGYYGSETQRDPEEMGFLESIYSYLFGDGNPNIGLEERRLALAAAMIRENKGVATAEQLAPFCDDAPSVTMAAESTYVDESFVLPIVSALGGIPVVTDEGEIAYVFDELQTTSSSSTASSLQYTRQSMDQAREARLLKRAGITESASTRDIVMVLNYNGISTRGVTEKSDLLNLLEQALPPMSADEQAKFDATVVDPTFLQERELKFSLASDLNKFLAGGLGVVNLGGALYLGLLLSQPPGFTGLIPFYPLLLGYAVLFNCIPLARGLYINRQNAQIRQRNARRQSWKVALVKALSSNDRISKKLKAVSAFKTKARQVGTAADIVYDTSKPIEELGKQKDQQSLAEFDKLLEGDDKAFQ